MSNKAPYFPWYPGDCDTDENVRLMNDRELGFYIRCLNHSWMNGSLPASELKLARLFRITKKYVDAVWPRVKPCWVVHSTMTDRLVNPKQEEFRDKLTIKSWKNSQAAAAKWGRNLESPEESLRDSSESLRSQRLEKARKKGKHTTAQWKSLLEFCEGTCVRCKKKDPCLMKDHITAIYRGGSDGIDNIQPLCIQCNAEKGPDNTDYRQNLSGFQEWLENACETHAFAGVSAGVSQCHARFVSVSDSLKIIPPRTKKASTRTRETQAGGKVHEFLEPWPRCADPDSAVRAWLSCIPDDAATDAAFACRDRYLASDEVARGVVMEPWKFIYVQSQNGWNGRWPSAKSRDSPRSKRKQERDRVRAMVLEHLNDSEAETTRSGS